MLYKGALLPKDEIYKATTGTQTSTLGRKLSNHGKRPITEKYFDNVNAKNLTPSELADPSGF